MPTGSPKKLPEHLAPEGRSLVWFAGGIEVADVEGLLAEINAEHRRASFRLSGIRFALCRRSS
jgi:hypothetical protein